jgi:hypothetical protein
MTDTAAFTRFRRGRLRRAPSILLLSVIVIAAAGPRVRAQSTTVDSAASERLTSYFRSHRLPLVGAQVSVDSSGARQVMLFGYVATTFGKTDAEAKARRYLRQPNINLINRIAIRPEILHLKPKKASGDDAGARPGDSYGDPGYGGSGPGPAP